MGRINVYIVLLCFSYAVKGQVTLDQNQGDIQIFPKEHTKLIINTDVVLAGEPLQYKIYSHTEQGTPSFLSKMAYVSLLAAKDSVVFKHKLKLKKGHGQGAYFIPTTLKTGVYDLLAYTNLSLNHSERGIKFKRILVINPFLKGNTPTAEAIDGAENIQIVPDTTKNVQRRPAVDALLIKTDKSSYAQREGVKLSIENPLGEEGYGNYVISVRKMDPIQISGPIVAPTAYDLANKNVFYLPELRGEIISGKVLALEGEAPIANQDVALTIPGEDYIFKTGRSNAYGRFYIAIDEPYVTANSSIQVVGQDRGNYKIVLDTKTLNLDENEGGRSLQLDAGLKDWLQERSIQIQIQNAYFNERSIISSEEKASGLFYGNEGRAYKLDDYTRFSTLEETFVEVVNFARIRNKGGKAAFEVFDPYNPYKEGPFSAMDPLLLLDGTMVQDHDEVFAYSAHDIDRIQVFPGAYRYGPMVFWGIIDISTKKRDFKPRLGRAYIKEFELVSPLTDRQYTNPDHSGNALQRTPDYRTQLYWDPNVQLSSKALSQHFYTSDVPGTYQIILEGYSDDGSYVMARQYFEVH